MSAKKKSSDYLCKYAEAQLGRPYWRGTFGQHASPALLAYERRRFPDSYKAKDFETQAKDGQKVHDCCGLVKAANVCDTVTEARGHLYGVVHSKITDKRWKFWSDDINIEYPKEEDEVKYTDLEVCRKGSKGDAVRTIQANVHVFVDGVFGADTEKAVKEFQKKNKDNDGHALTVDGVVGPKTWQAIIRGWEK